MHTRMWASTGEAWTQCNYTDADFPFILKSLPDGIPQRVQPSLAKTRPDEFLKVLHKFCKYPWFKEHHENDWRDTIRKLEAAG